jgi:hypothetical protein
MKTYIIIWTCIRQQRASIKEIEKMRDIYHAIYSLGALLPICICRILFIICDLQPHGFLSDPLGFMSDGACLLLLLELVLSLLLWNLYLVLCSESLFYAAPLCGQIFMYAK